MKLKHGRHLAYCTNIHRGETWPETVASLQPYTLAVRERVCSNRPNAIGLRLSNRAAHELNDPATFLAFRRQLDWPGSDQLSRCSGIYSGFALVSGGRSPNGCKFTS